MQLCAFREPPGIGPRRRRGKIAALKGVDDITAGWVSEERRGVCCQKCRLEGGATKRLQSRLAAIAEVEIGGALLHREQIEPGSRIRQELHPFDDSGANRLRQAAGDLRG